MIDITQVILELDAALVRIDPPVEGYRDNERSLVATDGSETIKFVKDGLAVYTRRQTKLRSALASLRALNDDGYPTDIHFTATAEVASVLARQLASQNAAFATITPVGEAVSAEVDLGTVTPT